MIHKDKCSAPICVDDYKETFIWYPGELICTKSSNFKWQAIQKRINKYLAKGNKVYYQEQPLNIVLLESRSF